MNLHAMTVAGRPVFTTLLTAVLVGTGCSRNDPAVKPHGAKAPLSATAAKTAAVAGQCAHKAPKELCFLCDASLRETGRLWCKEHERYEDRCWKCHPEAQDKARLFCDDHGLYEDECFLCHPELKKKATAELDSAAAAKTLMCDEHRVPEAECGVCHPENTTQLATGRGMKVRLPAPDSARSAGIKTARPSLGAMTQGVECYAEITFDQNRLAQIVAPVSGILQEVTVDLGSRVEEKQAVAQLWSASIAEAVAKAVLSHQTLDRERRLRQQRVTTQQSLQEAEAAHKAACQQLRTFGFTEEQIDTLGQQAPDQVLLPVRAPFTGEIVERLAVRGALAEAGKPLFAVADRSTMWAMLNIPEAALSQVELGQSVALHSDALPGRVFTGKLTWIAAELDERTRMVRARVEVPNPTGVLRSKMFARARILTGNTEGALLVPAGAVQRVEGKPILFVKLSNDLFEARVVELGPEHQGQTEVLAGITAEEEVAVQQVFPLKSQLLISRLGAGCAHDK